MHLISKHPKAKVLVETLDLGRLADVRSFAESLSRRVASGELLPISAIVCNAATLSLEAGLKFTSDGYEATFQVCHLSHYLLVLKLLGSVDPNSGRIVFIGSATHYPEKANPLSSLRPEYPKRMDDLVRPPPDQPSLVHDRGFQRYGTAKLANVTLVNDLNKRLAAVSQTPPLIVSLKRSPIDIFNRIPTCPESRQRPWTPAD
jgi:NAD(P)-dependent dehydrogenase (short-subunit alcohol dehydrogenase family)